MFDVTVLILFAAWIVWLMWFVYKERRWMDDYSGEE
jgi:hypothetical protein